VHEGNADEDLDHLQEDGEVTIIEANLEDLNNQANLTEDSRDDADEDDTILQYCSDSGNGNAEDDMPEDTDDD
jgi:hypothetical protein